MLNFILYLLINVFIANIFIQTFKLLITSILIIISVCL